jgi:hypothetical protein
MRAARAYDPGIGRWVAGGKAIFHSRIVTPVCGIVALVLFGGHRGSLHTQCSSAGNARRGTSFANNPNAARLRHCEIFAGPFTWKTIIGNRFLPIS